MNEPLPTKQSHDTGKEPTDPLLNFLHRIILYTIKTLAILMVVVILASLVDVVYMMYTELFETAPFGGLHVENILKVLGAFIAVLITIEIYNMITIYIKEDTIQAKIVFSTALIAIGRKVIIFDYKSTPAEYIYATAAMIVAVAFAFWVVCYKIPSITKPKD